MTRVLIKRRNLDLELDTQRKDAVKTHIRWSWRTGVVYLQVKE